MARKPKQSVTPTAWRNRIVGSGTVAASQLLANPSNWRVHPKAQQDALSGALDQIGWIQDVIVNQTTGHIVDGHLRVTLALRQGDDTPVPVKYVELTDAEERLALATIDPLSAMAATDKEQLDALLRDVAPDSPAVAEMLADVAKEAGLYGDKQNVDAEPQIDRAEELRAKWGVESGQLWQLGEHRLICGDCTDPAVVARVMGGEKATIVFTDPPYGVSIGAKNRLLNSVQPSGRNLTDIEADDMGADDLREMLLRCFKIVREQCADDGSVFVCAPCNGELGLMMMMMRDSGLQVRHVLNWVKNSPTFSLNNLDYDYQHEPILFTWIKTHKRNKRDGAFNTSIWPVDKPRSSKEHPTMKPVELPQNAIANHTDAGDVCYEPFSGSGTTIMACESLNRKCRAVEISPAYVAVALERWASATGKTPVQL